MSVFKRKPFMTSMFFSNMALMVIQIVACALGADAFYAIACHAFGALGAGASLWRGRDVSTERQARIDSRKHPERPTVDAFNPREVRSSDPEAAAEREIMRGPHSLWGQAQATIDRIDGELRHMEAEERDKAAKAEAERIAALPPEERKWAVFGGRPEMTSEEVSEIHERIKANGSALEPDFGWGDPNPRVRHGFRSQDPVWTLESPHPVLPLDSRYPVWTIDSLANAVKMGMMSKLEARKIIDEGRVR